MLEGVPDAISASAYGLGSAAAVVTYRKPAPRENLQSSGVVH